MIEPNEWLNETLRWTPWQPHEQSMAAGALPDSGGLYRIRVAGAETVEYIGQTGMGSMNLRKRMAMLRGVYKPEMPYRDPHTAGPALWALRQRDQCCFEVSVVPVTSDAPWRKSLEALAQAQYRQEHGCSPTLNFGRMPLGYKRSSANNRRLVEAGKRYRGGPSSETDPSHVPGIPPEGRLAGPCTTEDWCGHAWGKWHEFGSQAPPLQADDCGLYRIRRTGSELLVYVGEGRILDRLGAHRSKASMAGHRQAALFSAANQLEYSWVVDPRWLPHQRQELETDLIGSHVLAAHAAPEAQYLG